MSTRDLPAKSAGDYTDAAVQAWTQLHGEMPGRDSGGSSQILSKSRNATMRKQSVTSAIFKTLLE